MQFGYGPDADETFRRMDLKDRIKVLERMARMMFEDMLIHCPACRSTNLRHLDMGFMECKDCGYPYRWMPDPATVSTSSKKGARWT